MDAVCIPIHQYLPLNSTWLRLSCDAGLEVGNINRTVHVLEYYALELLSD